jgi:hypothetical protein
MADESASRSRRDDIDTRKMTPAARARRNRWFDIPVTIALCALCGLGGYMLGHGPARKRRPPIVLSEVDKQRPASSTPAPPAPPPKPLARLESVEATRVETVVRVRFATRVEKAAAEKAGHYAIEPGITVLAAKLADDGRTVSLTTSPLKHDVPYRLSIARIEMLPATPDDRRATFRYFSTRRVLQGLVALYDFEEGEGETVKDVARFGEPMDLRIVDTKAAQWIPGGLAITQSSHVVSDGDGTKIIEACQATKALTIEAWLKPANTSQGGPARIVTLSRGGSVRNFTLGQEGSRYYIRLRTTERDANGEPAVASNGGVAEALTHVVYTRNPDGKVAITINGQLNAAASVPGDFGNWTAFPFGLANEFDTLRTWLGELHLVAIYSRALAPDEIAQNYRAGPEGKTPQP